MGLQRIVVDFAAGDDGHFRVEKIDQAAEDAALGLAAEAEKNEIVAREQGIDDLRDDGVFVAVDAGEERFALFDGAEEIAAKFVFDGARGAARVEVGDALEIAESARFRMSGRLHGGACGHLGPNPRGPTRSRLAPPLIQTVSVAAGALAHRLLLL